MLNLLGEFSNDAVLLPLNTVLSSESSFIIRKSTDIEPNYLKTSFLNPSTSRINLESILVTQGINVFKYRLKGFEIQYQEISSRPFQRFSSDHWHTKNSACLIAAYIFPQTIYFLLVAILEQCCHTQSQACVNSNCTIICCC